MHYYFFENGFNVGFSGLKWSVVYAKMPSFSRKRQWAAEMNLRNNMDQITESLMTPKLQPAKKTAKKKSPAARPVKERGLPKRGEFNFLKSSE